MKAIPYILVVSLLSWMGSPAWATVGVAIMDAQGNIINASSSFKTPPLRTSETFRVVIDKHSDVDIPNWAGFRLKFHILDGTEVSVTPASLLYAIVPSTAPPGWTSIPGGPLVPPTFPQSTLAQTVPVFRTVWHPNAQQSGAPLPASKWVGMADFELHAKNTNIGQNSDVDMTVMAWCIRHLQPGPGSTEFRESALVWALSNFTPTPTQPIPTEGPHFNDPQGQWKHIPFPWHVPPGIGSNFIATLAGTAVIGLEHVPEPMTGVLAGGAVLSLICSWGLRRRRLAR